MGYPAQRHCRRPTTEQIPRLFSLTERQVLMRGVRTVRVFHPEPTELQHKVLDLLGAPQPRYQPPSI